MEYSRFFNSTTDDKRVYTAEDFAEFMSAFYSSGVIGEGLKVSKTGLNTITVSPGEAIIEGYYYKNTEDITLTLTGLNDKTIVLFLDKSIGERNIKVTQIDGNSVQSGYVDTQKEKFYLPIAKVTMKSSNEIAEISDRRTYCDGLFSVDLTEFRAQAEDAVNEIKTMSAEAVGDILSTAGGLPISSGGTGATNAEDARNYLGAAAESHAHHALDIDNGELPIEHGGTGASTAEGARANLYAAAQYHTHDTWDIVAGQLPIERGGTGADNAEDAIKAMTGDYFGWEEIDFWNSDLWTNGATSINSRFKKVECRKVGSQVFINGFFRINGTFEVDLNADNQGKILFSLSQNYSPSKSIYWRLPMLGGMYAKVFVTEGGTVGIDAVYDEKGTKFTNITNENWWFNFNNVSFFVD